MSGGPQADDAVAELHLVLQAQQRVLVSSGGRRLGSGYLRNAHLDVLATNQLARALYEEALDTEDQPPNLARFVFLDPRARRFYRDWDGIAHDAVGSLRTEAARTPGNTDLADLVDELATHSTEFAMRWDAHDVEYYRSGRQRFHHPTVGDLDLDYDALEIPADPGLTIVTYTVPATSADVLGRLQAHAAASTPTAPGNEQPA